MNTDTKNTAGKETACVLYDFVGKKICELESAPAEKAVWRHAFAKPLFEGQYPIKAWALLQRDIPGELLGKRPAGYAEMAAYITIAAYAACGSHSSGKGLAEAAGKLGSNSRDRFTRLELSGDIDELWGNMKSLLRLIASNKETGIDYRLLAKDIFYWQANRTRTVLYWEKSYYRKDKESKEEN